MCLTTHISPKYLLEFNVRFSVHIPRYDLVILALEELKYKWTSFQV